MQHNTFVPMAQPSAAEPQLTSQEIIQRELQEAAGTMFPQAAAAPAPAPEPAAEKAPTEKATVEKAPEPVFDPSVLPSVEFAGDPQNVTIIRPTTSDTKTNAHEVLALPAACVNTAEELTRSIPNLSSVKSRADLRWGENFLSAQSTSPADDALNDALSRTGSDWRQGVEVNGDMLRSQVPRFPAPKNSTLEGDQALQVAFSHMQLGDIFFTGLWNSGFWVSFKPAPDPVWMTINRLLGTSVLDLNRETYGLLHSNATQLAINTIITMLVPYVYTTSVNPTEMPTVNIRQHLSSLDEHDFIWGFISANYPRGFNIQRSCIAEASKCRHVINETIHVRELQLVDNAFLSEFHKNHMRSRGDGSMSLASVIEYQKRLAAQCDQVVKLSDTVGNISELVLSIPSSAHKAAMNDRYIADVREVVQQIVTSDVDMQQRSSLYDEQMTAVEMRMYQHWVKEIRMDSYNVVDSEAIGRILGTWTRDSELRIQFFDAVRAFIEKNAITVIGLQSAVCPACGKSHSRPDQKLRGMTDYIPLDMIQLFSNLAEFKARLVQARS